MKSQTPKDEKYFSFSVPNTIVSKKETYSSFISNVLAEHDLIYPEESNFIKNYLLGTSA